MKTLFVVIIFFSVAVPVLAQSSEEESASNLHQNPLLPGQAPVNDPRLFPSKEGGGIILPHDSSDLPKEVALVFEDKKKRSPISKDFILGFISGGILTASVSFFMLKFTLRVNRQEHPRNSEKR